MSPALSLRKENEYIAKLAQQAEHCKEMVEYMENVAKTIESEGSTTSSVAAGVVVDHLLDQEGGGELRERGSCGKIIKV
ncbi:hypothetical protein MRB53_011460 [Persea americana]|uniref:Uncharacterized protein n=1 Tax=Persea americana TaxID=3435 RepID=A0ACC2LV10_PERAE|nr:hypothetical protein MRB53_011460 [Persea americana]